MGVLVWGPLGQGLLTGRVRKGQLTDLRLTHLAMAFAIAHPA
jgi:aryl-alcohol dehydrogenase-like predicted oxidoreductase